MSAIGTRTGYGRCRMSSVTAAIWVTVFVLPSGAAAMTHTWLEHTEGRMVMISCREKITTTTQAATRPSWTRTISTASTKSLSASGSRNFPRSLTLPLRRASCPSTVSVSENAMNSAAATWSWLGKRKRRSAISTGMATNRLTVRAFGMFTGRFLRRSLRRELPRCHADPHRPEVATVDRDEGRRRLAARDLHVKPCEVDDRTGRQGATRISVLRIAVDQRVDPDHVGHPHSDHDRTRLDRRRRDGGRRRCRHGWWGRDRRRGALVRDDLTPRVTPEHAGEQHQPSRGDRRCRENRARPPLVFLQAKGKAWPVPRRGHPADEVLGVESEIGRIRPQVALRVHRGGEVREVLCLERLEMLAPDSRRSRNLVDREAALAALRSEGLSQGHGRGPRREIRWTGGPDPRRGRAPERAHLVMRKRGAEAATTEMGRMAAEDPSRIRDRDP